MSVGLRGAPHHHRARTPVETGEAGASAVEYAIMAGFIAAVVIVGVVFLGQSTKGSYDCTKESIDSNDARC